MTTFNPSSRLYIQGTFDSGSQNAQQSKLTLITGKDIFYTRFKDKLANLNRIGDGKSQITEEDIQKHRKSPVAIINAHGHVSEKCAYIDLIEGKALAVDNIKFLQEQLGTRHFYLLACHAGAIANSIFELKNQLQEGSTLTIFAGNEFILTSLAERTVRYLQSFYESHQHLPLKKIDRSFFELVVLREPWTAIRVEFTKKGCVAFKARGPKSVEDIKGYRKYVVDKKRIKVLMVENQSRFSKWQEAIQPSDAFFNWNFYAGWALIDAVIHQKQDRVKAWLEHGYIEFKDHEGKTPLIYASMLGHIDMIRLLLEKGAGIEESMFGERKPLHVACLNGQKEAVEVLLENKANIESKDAGGKTALIYASNHGHANIVSFLIEKGADIEAMDSGGRTALTVACYMGHEERVRLLIDLKAKVGLTENSKLCPLHAACAKGNTTIVQMLLEAGADIETVDPQGNEKKTPLAKACREGHIKTVQLLIKKGANIEAKDNLGRTPLILASLHGQKDVVSLLIEKGANIEAKDNRGKTSIVYANMHGHTKVVKLLEEAGDVSDIYGSDLP